MNVSLLTPYTVALVRIISIGIAAIAWTLLPTPAFKALFISVLFGHYALSFYYARRQVKNLAGNKTTWLPLLILTVASCIYIFSGHYIAGFVPFVGLHIALSEVYMLNQHQSAHLVHEQRTLWHLNLSRFFTSFSLFVLLLNQQVIWVHLLVMVSFAYFLWCLPAKGERFRPELRANCLIYELSGLGVAYFLYFKAVPISFQLFVFYHVTSWIIYPAAGFYQKKNWPALKKFTIDTVVSTAIIFVLSSPLILKNQAVDFAAVIPLWATLHFVSSFALSNLNPRYIARYFYPERAS